MSTILIFFRRNFGGHRILNTVLFFLVNPVVPKITGKGAKNTPPPVGHDQDSLQSDTGEVLSALSGCVTGRWEWTGIGPGRALVEISGSGISTPVDVIVSASIPRITQIPPLPPPG